MVPSASADRQSSLALGLADGLRSDGAGSWVRDRPKLGRLEFGVSLHGAELDAEAVRFASNRYPDVNFHEVSILDFESWPIHESVDACLLMDVLPAFRPTLPCTPGRPPVVGIPPLMSDTPSP